MYDTDLARHYAATAADAMREGRHAEAERYFDLAISEDPTYAPAYSDLSALYSIQGRHQEAFWAVQEALRHDPANVLYLYNVGTAYMQAGQHQQALPYLEQVVAQEPGYSLAVFNLAMCFDVLGRKGEALRWYQRAADLDPSDPDPVYNIAEIHAKRGDFRQAEGLCMKALDLFDAQFRNTQFVPWLPEGEPLSRDQLLADIAGRKATALALMGWIEANQGKLKPALASLQEATQINPYNSNWFIIMAEIHQKMGNHKDARKALARAQELG